MKLSLFTVSYAGLWGQHSLSLEGTIAKAAELGYDAVMIMGKRPHLSPLDATDERLAAIDATLKEHGVECAVMGGYTDLSGAGAAEVPFLEMQIAYVQSLAKIAARLGAGYVRIFTAYEVEGQSPHTVWSRAVTALQEICDRAAEHGVTIAVQNHHDIGLDSEALVELLGDVDRPNCKIGFDAWSPALRGEDIYEAAKRLAPHAAITTNADYIRLPRYQYQPVMVNYERVSPDLVRAVRFGEGFIDYPAFFQGLKEGGFDGIANFEMCSPVRGGGSLDNLDGYAGHYVKWMCENVVT
ncbi:MAG: sugar phosphate isomerase/epimerase [Planctomycetes bacterium]|nr:sugar phosphate isomerase/epimerase [Planctomycetota bacterium]MBL7041617.1 sugar phosphate isomerase/epimerase [Pirellulaceae bacterium]